MPVQRDDCTLAYAVVWTLRCHPAVGIADLTDVFRGLEEGVESEVTFVISYYEGVRTRGIDCELHWLGVRRA